MTPVPLLTCKRVSTNPRRGHLKVRERIVYKLDTTGQRSRRQLRAYGERVWRNWQTRRIQVPVPVKGVEVQLLSPALTLV
jgi:hypothetical protein